MSKISKKQLKTVKANMIEILDKENQKLKKEINNLNAILDEKKQDIVSLKAEILNLKYRYEFTD